MPPDSSPRRRPRRSLIALAVVLAVLFLAAMPAADLWTWHHVRMEGVYNHDWARLLRSAGFAPTWLLGAAVLMLARGDRMARQGWRVALMPGLALLASVAASGILAEIIKLLVRRARPAAHDGAYGYVPWDGNWSTGAIGLPSSHAIVAFAAAFALARLAPRTGPVWYLLAVGCALTRLLDGAHFLSDVVAAALLAWVTVAWVFRGLRPETAGVG
jgi:membrane-associated phospholipid phosphatase